MHSNTKFHIFHHSGLLLLFLFCAARTLAVSDKFDDDVECILKQREDYLLNSPALKFTYSAKYRPASSSEAKIKTILMTLKNKNGTYLMRIRDEIDGHKSETGREIITNTFGSWLIYDNLKIAIKMPKIIVAQTIPNYTNFSDSEKLKEIWPDVRERKNYGVPVWELRYKLPKELSVAVNAQLKKLGAKSKGRSPIESVATYIRKNDGAPIGEVVYDASGKPVFETLAMTVDSINNVIEDDFNIPLGYKIYFPQSPNEFQALLLGVRTKQATTTINNNPKKP